MTIINVLLTSMWQNLKLKTFSDGDKRNFPNHSSRESGESSHPGSSQQTVGAPELHQRGAGEPDTRDCDHQEWDSVSQLHRGNRENWRQCSRYKQIKQKNRIFARNVLEQNWISLFVNLLGFEGNSNHEINISV